MHMVYILCDKVLLLSSSVPVQHGKLFQTQAQHPVLINAVTAKGKGLAHSGDRQPKFGLGTIYSDGTVLNKLTLSTKQYLAFRKERISSLANLKCSSEGSKHHTERGQEDRLFHEDIFVLCNITDKYIHGEVLFWQHKHSGWTRWGIHLFKTIFDFTKPDSRSLQMHTGKRLSRRGSTERW